jgi:hypothetical protein
MTKPVLPDIGSGHKGLVGEESGAFKQPRPGPEQPVSVALARMTRHQPSTMSSTFFAIASITAFGES